MEKQQRDCYTSGARATNPSHSNDIQSSFCMDYFVHYFIHNSSIKITHAEPIYSYINIYISTLPMISATLCLYIFYEICHCLCFQCYLCLQQIFIQEFVCVFLEALVDFILLFHSFHFLAHEYNFSV